MLVRGLLVAFVFNLWQFVVEENKVPTWEPLSGPLFSPSPEPLVGAPRTVEDGGKTEKRRKVDCECANHLVCWILCLNLARHHTMVVHPTISPSLDVMDKAVLQEIRRYPA